MYKYIFFFLSALIYSSCTEVITIDTELSENITIVDGYIGAEALQSYIKVSNVVGFYDDVKDNTVSNASIIVARGNDTLPFLWDEDRKLYAPTQKWSNAVSIGEEFEMQMQLDGEQYTANDLMAETAKCTLRWRDDNDEWESEYSDEYYQVRLTIADNKDKDNYYYTKFYRSKKQITSYGYDIIDDALFDVSTVEMPYRGSSFKYGDTVSVINYGISRDAYEYFSQANSMLQNDGGLFTPIPANPYSNINGGKGKVIGFFRASMAAYDTVIIGDSTRWSPSER
ncbi:MAG: DUF4249 family protein [Bacteroidales bacterium]